MSTDDDKDAVDRITEALADPSGQLSRRVFHAKAHQLAMQWPSLAAALGDLLAEHDLPVPGPFRHAQNVMLQERQRELSHLLYITPRGDVNP